jgi:hypothetical protein
MLTAAEILGGRTRFDAVSGLYRNTRQDDCSGSRFADRRAFLVVAGAVAVESAEFAPATADSTPWSSTA